MAMSKMERVRFLQGACLVASLLKCGHEFDEIRHRLDVILRGWQIGAGEVRGPGAVTEITTTFDEAMADVLDAEREGSMH
jgi:hypothetical protein